MACGGSARFQAALPARVGSSSPSRSHDKDVGGHDAELGELLEAVIRPLLREQEQNLTRSISAMLDSFRAVANPLVGLDIPEPRPAAGPRSQDSCRQFDGLERQFSAPPEIRGGGFDRQVSESSKASLAKSPRHRKGKAPGVKSLEDARGTEILSGMTKNGRLEQELGAPVWVRATSAGDRASDSAEEPELEVGATRSLQSALGRRGRPSLRGILGGAPRQLVFPAHARGLSPRRSAAGAACPTKTPGPPEFLDICGAPPEGRPGAEAHGQRWPRGAQRPPPQEACGAERREPPHGVATTAGHAGIPRDGAEADEGRPGPPGLPRGAPLGDARAEAQAPAACAGPRPAPAAAEAPSAARRESDAAGRASGGGAAANAGSRIHVHLAEEAGGKGQLGVEVLEALAGDERGLLITAVREGGLVAAWNRKRAEGRLGVGDRIVEVNGRTKDLTSVLSQALAGGESVDIVAMPGAAVHQGAGAPRERGQATGVLPVAARSALGDELSPCASDETLTKLPEAGSGGEPTAEGMPSSDSDGSWGAPLPLPGRAGSRSHSQSTTRWQSEPGRGGRADGDQAQLCQTASSESSAWPVRSKRPHLSTGSTVQTVRQGREDGLVEEMVQSQDLGTAMGPTLSIDSMAVEDEVSAPLWLRICGTLPWSQAAALHTCYRSLVLASMALIVCFLVFAAVYAPSGSCEREVCLGYVQIADLALAVGSLVGLLSMQSLASLGILGNSESILVAYARRQDITAAWSAAMRGHNVRLGLLWICSVVLRCVSLLNGSRPTLLDAASTGSYAVVSLVFMSIVGGILHVSCALTMAIDSYVTHFDGLHFRLDTSVYEWNLLQAVLRKVSGAVEKTFLAVQSTAAALVTGVILAGRGLLMAGSLGDLTWLFSAALLVVGVMFIFFKAAEASERCMRMPSLINSLNFGECVDTRRHYLVEFMSYSAAGFYVGEVRLTTAIALKLTYFCCILAFAGLSELYAEDAASF